MEIEVVVKQNVEVIEALQITMHSDDNGKFNQKLYFVIEGDELINLVKNENVNMKNNKTLHSLKETLAETVEIKVNLQDISKELKEAVLSMIQSAKFRKENTTTENSDELKICGDCGVQAEHKNAKFCFHCGINLD